MGKLAAMYSDFVYVTSDNPRTEQPDAILQDIELGLIAAEVDKAQYRLIVDRRQAIQEAIAMATPGDIVLIAGKGHETYQLIGGEMLHFDDREEARAAIRGLHI
jgi:UDP-N-acetylmuramoyl-L-alanyl-D-glutamate--2,6-diaminopimelate ligase